MQFSDISLSLTLSLIMFAIGTSLRLRDFKNLFNAPFALYIGLVMQMLVLPLICLLLVYWSDISPFWKIGLFILSLCPGGTTSNMISYIIKADVALGISLTSLNSTLVIFTIPILTNFGLYLFDFDSNIYTLNIKSTFLQVLTIYIIPIGLGVWFNEKKSELSRLIQKPLHYLVIILLAVVFGIKYFGDVEIGGSGLTSADIKGLLPYCLSIHLLSMLGSYFVSKFYLLTKEQAITISAEVGLQNTTLALLIASSMLKSYLMTQPALVYAMFSFFTTLGFAFLIKRFTK